MKLIVIRTVCMLWLLENVEYRICLTVFSLSAGQISYEEFLALFRDKHRAGMDAE